MRHFGVFYKKNNSWFSLKNNIERKDINRIKFSTYYSKSYKYEVNTEGFYEYQPLDFDVFFRNILNEIGKVNEDNLGINKDTEILIIDLHVIKEKKWYKKEPIFKGLYYKETFSNTIDHPWFNELNKTRGTLGFFKLLNKISTTNKDQDLDESFKNKLIWDVIVNDSDIKTLKTKENNIEWMESIEPYVDEYNGELYIFCEGTDIDEGRHLFTVREWESHNVEIIHQFGESYYTLILKPKNPAFRSFLVFDNNSCSEGLRYYEVTNLLNNSIPKV